MITSYFIFSISLSVLGTYDFSCASRSGSPIAAGGGSGGQGLNFQ